MLSSERPLAIYCETRAEWLMLLFAAVTRSIPVATVYISLGPDALVSVINDVSIQDLHTQWLTKHHL